MVAKKSKQASWVGGYVQPKSESNLRLGPGLYSISSRCNLPYVSFQGSNGFNKTISWGEVAEIDCEQLVTVWNDSYHGGNLFINSGVEPYPMPSAITVPVAINGPGGEFAEIWTDPVDTRRARRAFLAVDITNGDVATPVTVIGRTSSSLGTTNLLGAPTLQGAGYLQTHLINPNVQYPLIPIGFKAPMGDDARPHVLLDSAQVNLGQVVGGQAAYFVMEY